MTLVLPLSGTSQRWIATLRHWIIASLQRHDVGSQRRDIGLYLPWNVATSNTNVATSNRNVATSNTNVATFACKLLIIFFPTITHPYRHPLLLPPTSDHLTASAPTSRPPPTVVLRPCLAHPPPRSGALTPDSIGSL